MKPSLWVFWFGQFMEFFTPYMLEYFDVQVYDRTGKNTKIIDVWARGVPLEQAAACDFVLLGYPAWYIEPLVKDISSFVQPGVVVFDICSVKTPAVEAMLGYLPKNCHIIGTHPIFWPQSGKNGITWLKMTFSNIRSDTQVFADFMSLFRDNMNLQVFEMTAQEHDRQMAYIQWITHFIWRAITELSIPNSPIATESYLHLQEVGEMVWSDSEALFLSIQKDNPFTEDIRATLMKELGWLQKLIQDNS